MPWGLTRKSPCTIRTRGDDGQAPGRRSRSARRGARGPLPVELWAGGGKRRGVIGRHSFEDTAAACGGKACKSSSFGMGAEPGHHKHRSPSTRVPTEASG
jgi:hypothetical protein